jgi:hypothetical protein
MPKSVSGIFLFLNCLFGYLHCIAVVYVFRVFIRGCLRFEGEGILRYSIGQISIFFSAHHKVKNVVHLFSIHIN